MRRALGFAVGLGLCLLAAGTPTGRAGAEVPTETIGRVEVLPHPPSAHWVWVSDLLLRRTALLDLDRGEFIGMMSTGYFSQEAAFPGAGSEFYLPETYYSRGSRGERTDVVTVYDTGTIGPVAEIVIPPKRAINVLPSGNVALLDEGRFLAVHNMTPATSVSVVDLRERRFVAEVSTPGCALVFAGGPRRFFSLCADGSLLAVTLDPRGRELRRAKSTPFFDPLEDPVTEKAVRYHDTWLFVSFEGHVHPVDVSGEEIVPTASWSLFDDDDRADGWRIGGIQHLAVHERSGRFYSLVHQGGPDTHKAAGSELWVYDPDEHELRERIELPHPGFALVSETIEVGAEWPAPFDGLWGWLLDNVIPSPGLDSVTVTRDDEPLLVVGSQIGGSVAVLDADSGELLRRVTSGNLTCHVLQAPWDGGR